MPLESEHRRTAKPNSGTRFWLSATTLTLLLHYAWEIGQAQLFSNHQDQPFTQYALHCLIASFGDLAIAGTGYLAVSGLFNARYWVFQTQIAKPALIWILIGITFTIAFEMLATKTGRWNYSSEMPTLFGIGLLPVLQWSILPPTSLFILRVHFRRDRLEHSS